MLLTSCGQVETERERFAAHELSVDLQVLKEVLDEVHHGLYRFSDETRFAAVFDAIQGRLTDSMSAIHFYRLITASLMDEIQCGHTNFIPPTGVIEHLIPVDVYVVNDSLYVHRIKGFAKDPSKALLIRSINEIDSQSILGAMRRGIPADAKNEHFKHRILEVDFNRYYPYLLEEAEIYEIEAIDMITAKDTIIRVPAITWEELQGWRSEYPTKRDNKLHSYLIDSLGVAYLKIGSFEGWRLEKQGLHYNEYMDSVFNSLGAQDVEYLIVDLRWNMGGDTDKGATLLSYLTDAPFQMYKKVTASSNHYDHLKHTNKGWRWNVDLWHDHQKNQDGEYEVVGMNRSFDPKPNAFEGDIYFLVNGSTHSTASTVAVLAQSLKLGPLIGETPSGTYAGYNGGSWVGLTLPNTRIYAAIPIRTFHNNIFAPVQKTDHIQTDYVVTYSIKDKVEERDLALEQALELIQSAQAR